MVRVMVGVVAAAVVIWVVVQVIQVLDVVVVE